MTRDSDHYIKRCATVMACNMRDRCKYAHVHISGAVQFFVPRNVGEMCDSYVPHFVPWGNAPDCVEND